MNRERREVIAKVLFLAGLVFVLVAVSVPVLFALAISASGD